MKFEVLGKEGEGWSKAHTATRSADAMRETLLVFLQVMKWASGSVGVWSKGQGLKGWTLVPLSLSSGYLPRWEQAGFTCEFVCVCGWGGVCVDCNCGYLLFWACFIQLRVHVTSPCWFTLQSRSQGWHLSAWATSSPPATADSWNRSPKAPEECSEAGPCPWLPWVGSLCGKPKDSLWKTYCFLKFLGRWPTKVCTTLNPGLCWVQRKAD